MLTEFVPFYGILFITISFEINGEELILCESFVLFGIENMVSDVWKDFW